MTAFKVGDRVRVRKSPFTTIAEGDAGVIIKILEDKRTLILSPDKGPELDGAGNAWHLYPEELELLDSQ